MLLPGYNVELRRAGRHIKKFIAEVLDVDPEFIRDDVARLLRIVLRIVFITVWVFVYMRQRVVYTDSAAYEFPVFFQALEFSNIIHKNIPMRVYKPIKLITMGQGINARSAAELDPVNELIEGQFVA
jgi:hypothetical protein